MSGVVSEVLRHPPAVLFLVGGALIAADVKPLGALLVCVALLWGALDVNR